MQNAERVPRSNGLRCYHQGSSSRGSFIALMLPNIAWAPPYVTGSLLLGSRDTEPRECLHVHKCPRLPVSSFLYDCGRFLCHGHLPVSLQLPLLRRPAYPVCGHGLLFPKLRWYRGTEMWTGIPACVIHCFFALGTFFTTNYLSQVKQICKSHSLWANSLCRDSQLSVKMGFTFKGSASASSLCTCPYIIPTFWTSPKEWVSTYLTSAWPKSQLCFPEKWENLPEGKRKSRKHTRMQKCLLVPKFWLYFCFDFVCYTRYLGLDFAFWLTLSLFSSKEAWFA